MSENLMLAIIGITAGLSWTTKHVVRMALAYRTTRRRDQAKQATP